MRLCATAQPAFRAADNTWRVLAIAEEMLPPPKMAGSAKPFTKSTMSKPTAPWMPRVWPNPCRR
jgi:hypothetical protein